MEVNDFEILLDWCHVLSLTCPKAGIQRGNKNEGLPMKDFQRGNRFQRFESDVSRRQILTS